MGNIISILGKAGVIYLIYKAGQMRAVDILIGAAKEQNGTATITTRHERVTITVEEL